MYCVNMKKYVVTVNEKGDPVGLVEKQEAHERGLLHLAFSIFIFRRRGSALELLLQRRALDKYHSAGLWTNTCCSHMEENVPLAVTAPLRLAEEMGFSCPLQQVGTFQYRAEVGPGMIEHELDTVLVGFADPEKIVVNPQEAMDFAWRDTRDIERRLQESPQEFTAWFSPAYKIAKSALP